MRQSSNIYDKFDSLRSQDGGDALSFWSVVSIGLAGLLVLVGCYLLFRGLWARALVARAERRGQPPVVDQGSGFDGAPIALHSGPDWLSEEEFLRGSDLDFSHLDLEPGECMGLFWNLDGLRCGCLARVEISEAQRLIAKVESELLPRGERLSVVIPELQGHVTFCHAIATGHDDPYRVQLEFDDESPPVRMHRRHRLPVTMKVAAARQDVPSQAPMVLRVADLALDGMGLLSEEEFEVGTKLHVRMQLPGVVEPFSSTAEVAWSRSDIAGLWRSGATISLESLEVRVHLADFIGQAELGADS